MGNPYRRLSENRRPVVASAATREDSERRRASVKEKIVDRRNRVAMRPKGGRIASRKDEALFENNKTFNPQRYSYPGADSVRNAMNTNRRMFDKSGQINANDNKDALTQVYHLLNNVTKKNANRLSTYDPQSPAEKMGKEARREILAAALSDPSGAGWHMVAQELALPIKAILDYEGFARKFFRVRHLAQAEFFRIAKDVRAVAYQVGQDGMTPEARIHTTWFTPPEFKIASFPTVDTHDILLMNFDVLDRAQDTARQEIELQEDKAAVTALDAASQAVNAVTTYASLGIGALEAVRFQVERHRLQCANFLINRAELSDIITTMATAVDMVTERELILAGYIGSVLNCQILTSAGIGAEEVVPAGTFYAVTDKDYFGEMGIRGELVAEPFNKLANRETVKGFALWEYVGMGIPTARSSAKGLK